VVRFGAHRFARIELRAIGGGCHRCQIPLAYVYAQDASQGSGGRVRNFQGQGDQQGEPLFGAIKPEFGTTDDGSLLQQIHMFLVALKGQVDTALKSQEAYLLPVAQGIIPPVVVEYCGGTRTGRLIQALEAFLRPSLCSCLSILAGFGPEALIGTPHLPRHIAGHLGGQTKLTTQLGIRLFLEAFAIAGFPMSKRVDADKIQRIAVGQLGLPQKRELIRCGRQLQLGRI
jgi:hypothetical protein